MYTRRLTIILLAKSLYSAPDFVPAVPPSVAPACDMRLGGGGELPEASLACRLCARVEPNSASSLSCKELSSSPPKELLDLTLVLRARGFPQRTDLSTALGALVLNVTRVFLFAVFSPLLSPLLDEELSVRLSPSPSSSSSEEELSTEWFTFEGGSPDGSRSDDVK